MTRTAVVIPQLALCADASDLAVLTGRTRPNGLLIGSRSVTNAVLHSVEALLEPAVFHWPADGCPWSAAPCFRTLILQDVEKLDAWQQCELLSWMESQGAGVQVISVSSTLPYALVQRGTFLESLYYRLNTLYLRCSLVPARRVVDDSVVRCEDLAVRRMRRGPRPLGS